MRRIFKYSLLLLMISVFFFCSCKKEEDNTLPVISIDTPLENDIFYSRDTIPVAGTASDDTGLEYIRIVIWDENNTAVSKPHYLYPDGNNYVIALSYIIDEPSLPTGQYTLVATASDGRNSQSAYRSIRIKGIDKAFEKALVFCQPNMLRTYLYSISLEGKVSASLTIDKGYQASCISSSKRQLLFTNPEPSVMLAYDLDDLVADEWIYASPPAAYFTDIITTQMLTYVSTGNGDIKGLDNSGTIVYVTMPNADTIPLRIYDHFNYILSYCERKGSQGASIRQYYKASGILRISKGISFSVSELFSLDTQKCILFGNSDGSGSVREYGPEDNYILALKDIPSGAINDVVQISEEEFMIAHETGLILYTYPANSVFDWYPGLEADIMEFDALNRRLWAVSGPTIYIIDAVSGTMLEEITMPYPVLNLHLQYTI